MEQKIILSISLLISDRLETIAKCLDSLKPIMMSVPSELILVDTSRNPKVHELLQTYTDHIITFDWCNDFSKARNAGLKEARGEWFLYLDDDEWFTDSEAIIHFFASGQYKECGEACYIQRNYLDMEGLQYSDSWVSRMFRLTPETRFVSKIHEYATPLVGNRIALDSVVDHYGYVFENPQKAREHYERNTTLLLEMIEREPSKLRWRMEMAQEYFLASEYEKLYDLGMESLILAKKKSGINEDVAIETFYASIILALECQGKYEQMLKICKQADKDVRAKELLRSFVALHQSDVCVQMHRYEEAEQKIEEYFSLRRFFETHPAELMIQKTAPLVGSIFDGLKLFKAYSIHICAGLGQHNLETLEKEFDRLQWKQDTVYVYDEIIPCLVSIMDEMPENPIWRHVFPVLYENGLLWNYYCEAYRNYTEDINQCGAKGEGIRKILQLHHCVEEMDVYCSSMKAKWQLLYGNDDKDDYDKERKLLIRYARETIAFYELHRRISEEVESQPSAFRAAKRLDEALEVEEIQPSEFLSKLGECVNLDPILANPIKNYIFLYQYHMRKKEFVRQTELNNLAKQIKEQAQKLINTDDTETAINILEQLRVMMPDDLEIMELILMANLRILG